ncbi:methyltransferase domain-containing protein [Paenibacillus sp. LMG 31459]|uniref:Methyltransferase domain-containing protein n=1 Tax=Paenibacillus phytohabitans TaxID=2654978 RepID=A0ABX1YM11_9BACL|nr:class I SAM-dependent methyltransferase [Paenibacillus phytohabitans]NOU81569.1 methyltransferase domain-containing protein [Paenibacillus phytohabitans]
MSIQQEVEMYWEGEAELYSEGIQKELNGFQREAWLKLILAHAPQKERLHVLDIGCGPGFFSVILSSAGHLVTAVDCTDNMLEEARAHTSREGVTVTFRKMDSHKLDFAAESFDLIVCRNVTWSLTHPLTAYKEWKRVLKPGGRLQVFDANWNRHLWDEEMKRKHAEDQQAYVDKGFGELPHHKDIEETDRLSLVLPLTREWRPEWDIRTLKEEGYSAIYAEENLNAKVLDEKQQVLNRSTPMFMICAEK